MSHRRLVLLSLCVVIMCAGQMCVPTSGRLEVNDNLRATCPGWTDADIDASLTSYEQFRKEGIPYSHLVVALDELCGGDDVCYVCHLAIQDQVYE